MYTRYAMFVEQRHWHFGGRQHVRKVLQAGRFVVSIFSGRWIWWTFGEVYEYRQFGADISKPQVWLNPVKANRPPELWVRLWNRRSPISIELLTFLTFPAYNWISQHHSSGYRYWGRTIYLRGKYIIFSENVCSLPLSM